MYGHKRVPNRCCESGCDKPRYCYGRCTTHFAHLDPTLAASLKGMTRAERNVEFQRATMQPERPRWEFEGDEQFLIDKLKREEEALARPTEQQK